MFGRDPFVTLAALVLLLVALLVLLVVQRWRARREEPGQFGAGDLEEWLDEIRPGRHRAPDNPEEDQDHGQ